MQIYKITNQELLEFQQSTWKTYCSQDQTHLEVNLLGQWSVRDKEERINCSSLETAKEEYIAQLGKKIPRYKIAVEFVD